MSNPHRVIVIALAGLAATNAMTQVQAMEPNKRSSVDACAYLRTEELSEVLHSRIEQGVRNDAGEIDPRDEVAPGAYSSTCLWRIVDRVAQPLDPAHPLRGASYVILTVMRWPPSGPGGKQFLQSFVDASRSGAIDHAPEPLQMADGALWWGDGVAAYKQDRSFGISVHLVGERDRQRKVAETLASRIAARL